MRSELQSTEHANEIQLKSVSESQEPISQGRRVIASSSVHEEIAVNEKGRSEHASVARSKYEEVTGYCDSSIHYISFAPVPMRIPILLLQCERLPVKEVVYTKLEAVSIVLAVI